MADSGEITVFYDGACPACVRDREAYERLAGGCGGVAWFDITGRDAELRALGIDPQQALLRLHLCDPEGRIVSELDAYILLLGRIPRLRFLAWLIGLPVVRPLLSRLYRWLVLRRLRREGRL